MKAELYPFGVPQTEITYARPWLSNTDRLAALDDWVGDYNTRRAHSALGSRPARATGQLKEWSPVVDR